MGLVNSGSISIGGSTVGRSINLELGRSATATSSLNDSALRDLADVSSGAISLSSFYGKSSLPAGGSDYISGIGTMGATQTLTLNSSTNLNLGSSGAALTMIDIDGNTANYTPQTSTISSIATANNWSPGTQTWGGYWGGSSYRRYFFNPAIAVTVLRTDSSGTGSYGRLLRASYNGNMYTSSPQNGSITGTKYNNDQDWNALWGTSSHGPQNAVGNFYQINFSTSWLLDELWVVEDYDWSADAVSINGVRLTNNQYFPVLTFSSSNNQDLKFFKAGDAVQTGVNVLSTDTTANTMKLEGGNWEGSNGSKFSPWLVTLNGTNSSGNSQAYRIGNDFIQLPQSNQNLTEVRERFEAISAGTLSMNFYTSDNTTYQITDSSGMTTGLSSSGTLVNNTYYNYTFTFAGAGDYFEIKYTFPQNGQVTHYSLINDSRAVTEWQNNTLYFSGSKANIALNQSISFDTKATGPAKSGTGNFSSSSSNTVTVSSSNSEWISDDNRLGTKHYIKLV